jgi:hypothetical protein
MNLRTLCAFALWAALLCGCASAPTPKFTPYTGSEVFHGKGGGSVTVVDGIDFWEEGDANRDYLILGMIEKGGGRHMRLPGRIGGLVPHSHNEFPAIAKQARDKGGNAVLVLAPEPADAMGDDDMDMSERPHRRGGKFVVIKYVSVPPGAAP